MDQRGGLQRLAGSFVRHLIRRQPAQRVVNQREQFLGSLGISVPNGGKNSRDFARVGF
jgi:hypothetical protein